MNIFVLFSFCLFTVNCENIVQRATHLGANTLVNIIHQAGLTNTLSGGGPFTVFAPTDAAFAKVPTNILQKLKSDNNLLTTVLKYHVVSGLHFASEVQNELLMQSLVPEHSIRVNIYRNGQVVTVEGSKVILTNQNASNGVIHLIDHVMYPLPDNTLLQYVAMQPDMSQLVYSVIRANLQDELAGGPFTVFAPVDSAFDALPSGYLNDNFLDLEHSRRLIRYHVIKGTYYSAALMDGMMVPTAEGDSLQIHIRHGNVMVNNAKVTRTDISVTNGVIHIIDTFLQSPNITSNPHQVIG